MTPHSGADAMNVGNVNRYLLAEEEADSGVVLDSGTVTVTLN